MSYDLVAHIYRQRAFSRQAFGPGVRLGVLDHIRKELVEVAEDPTELGEWIDVILLALDGAWRSGASPELIARALAEKQDTNERRTWPDWRGLPTDRAIEHVRGDTETAQGER